MAAVAQPSRPPREDVYLCESASSHPQFSFRLVPASWSFREGVAGPHYPWKPSVPRPQRCAAA